MSKVIDTMIHRLLVLALGLTCLSPARLFAQSSIGSAESNKEAVRFDRHVQPLLSKLGCNAGACHGNSEGRGGLRLSLFGADPKMDFLAFSDEQSGRIDRKSPSQSLVLQKPSMIVEHGGGQRFENGSLEYETFRRWIELGAVELEKPDPLRELEVSPATCKLNQTEPEKSFQVVATFQSGEKLDVTALCTLRIADESVAAVQKQTIKCLQPGKTFLIATYAGRSANATIIVPREREVSAKTSRSASSEHGPIDQLIDKQLIELGIDSSPSCDDATFLRRLRLTTLGSPPDVETIKRFVGNNDPKKREKAIDECLASSLHASVLATRMCEILGSRDTGNFPNRLEHELETKWHAWFQARFDRNERYDVLVRHILVATSRDQLSAMDYVDNAIHANENGQKSEATEYAKKASLDLFWQRWKVNEEVDFESLAERISAAFLGVRIECAKCHKHPFDRWTQDDYRAFSNIFTQVRYGMSGELRIALSDKLQEQRAATASETRTKRIPPLHEIYLSKKPFDFVKTTDNASLPPKPLAGEPLRSDGDRREYFAIWLLDQSNPYFARNFVNRVWDIYFGSGLVDPVDAFSATNSPSNAELLDFLANEFVKSGFDVRQLETAILNSHAWQRSAKANGEGSSGTELYARFPVRILPACAIVDSLSNALREESTPTTSLPTFAAGSDTQQYYFDVFSRPERKSRCDCERFDHPTLRQSMLLLSDEGLSKRIDVFVEKWLGGMDSKEDCASEEHIAELFLSALARWPTPAELRVAQEHFANKSNRDQAAADILWSLINTSEFVTLH